MALREIALRRRGDADVKALLWEIRRLHEALAEAGDLFEPLPKVRWDTRHLDKWKALAQVIAASTAIVRPPVPRREVRDPSLPDSRPLRRWRPAREPVTGHAERRAQQVPEETDREATRRARQERG